MDKNNCYIIYYLHIVTQWIRKSIFYTKEIVNVILLLNSIHLVFLSFLISQLAYIITYLQSNFLEES